MPSTSNLSIDQLASYLVTNQNTAPTLLKGAGAEIEDEDGKRYIDLEAGPGVASVGHCHPRVVDAIRKQAGNLLQAPGRYHSRLTLTLAKRLVDRAGGVLRRVFFANSGAEATDGSVKCALKYAANTGKRGFGIIALQHAFHGRLSLPLALTGIAKQKLGMGPYGTFPNVIHAPAPYCYRCPFGLTAPGCGVKCADYVETMIKTEIHGEPTVFIGEPILGVGGIIVPPDEYWAKIEKICRNHGIVLIQDEVFTGFARTGAAFAHHHYGVKPDVMAFAKAIGGGIPLGGFIASEPLGTAFEPADHFTTFGSKNQLGIAAGHAVLDVIDDEGLAANARERGEQLLDGLRGLARRFPIVGDVRGRGLMVGIEIIRDRDKTPAADLAKQIERELVVEGALISTTGVNGNNLRFTPPLVITANQIDRVLAMLGRVLLRVSPVAETI